jgi:hypothetical protein
MLVKVRLSRQHNPVNGGHDYCRFVMAALLFITSLIITASATKLLDINRSISSVFKRGNDVILEWVLMRQFVLLTLVLLQQSLSPV